MNSRKKSEINSAIDAEFIDFRDVKVGEREEENEIIVAMDIEIVA